MRAKKKFMKMSVAILLAVFFTASCGGAHSKVSKKRLKKLTSIELKDKYSYVDPDELINPIPLELALEFYDQNLDWIANQDYLSVVDFSLHSSRQRFFVIDMVSGHVEARKTAHGSGSDVNNDGYAERFSNIHDSHMSSVGFYQASETYYSSRFQGTALRLDGLSPTNSNARARAIVIHPADYVDEDSFRVGRSWGCPALDPDHSTRIINNIKDGSIIFAWADQ